MAVLATACVYATIAGASSASFPPPGKIVYSAPFLPTTVPSSLRMGIWLSDTVFCLVMLTVASMTRIPVASTLGP